MTRIPLEDTPVVTLGVILVATPEETLVATVMMAIKDFVVSSKMSASMIQRS